MLAEREAIKRGVGALRGLVEGERRRVGNGRHDIRHGHDMGGDEVVVFDDEDDKSIQGFFVVVSRQRLLYPRTNKRPNR
jgi:hypothetical protein